MTKQERKNAALNAYEAIQGPAWEAYKAIKKPAWEAYEAIQVPAWEACEAEIERIDNEPDEEIIEVDGKRYQLIKITWNTPT